MVKSKWTHDALRVEVLRLLGKFPGVLNMALCGLTGVPHYSEIRPRTTSGPMDKALQSLRKEGKIVCRGQKWYVASWSPCPRCGGTGIKGGGGK